MPYGIIWSHGDKDPQFLCSGAFMVIIMGFGMFSLVFLILLLLKLLSFTIDCYYNVLFLMFFLTFIIYVFHDFPLYVVVTGWIWSPPPGHQPPAPAQGWP